MQKKGSDVLQWIFYFVYFLMGMAVVLRMAPHYLRTPSQNLFFILIAGYFALLISERWILRIFKPYFYVYAVLQLGIILALFAMPTETAPQDYFANLVLPLSGQAIWDQQTRKGYWFVGGFSIFCVVVMMLVYGALDGLGFAVSYVAGCIIVAVLSSATLRSIRAREESQQLLLELRDANQKLVDYSQKVERLSASEERNRLARELHDSVSQTIFSMTLTAQAAKMLLESDPPRTAGLLDHLQTLSQNALQEMRTLIQELRPHSIVENGLRAALIKHAAERENQDNLAVKLQIDENLDLSTETAEGLYRVVQEALNNIVKHAQTNQAEVTIEQTRDWVNLTIKDHGAGYDPKATRHRSGHVGLQSMQERVESMGGTFNIDSSPDKGTTIEVTKIPTTATQKVSTDLISNREEV
jgi:signal transduction histidine kinase